MEFMSEVNTYWGIFELNHTGSASASDILMV
jgi:hypothetical protein